METHGPDCNGNQISETAEYPSIPSQQGGIEGVACTRQTGGTRPGARNSFHKTMTANAARPWAAAR